MINKQAYINHGYKFNNKNEKFYGYSPILDPVIKLNNPIELQHSLRVYEKTNPTENLIDYGVNCFGEKSNKMVTIKMFTNNPNDYKVTYHDTIQSVHSKIYFTSEYKEIKRKIINDDNLSSYMFGILRREHIKNEIDKELINKSNKNHREHMNTCMVGEHVYVDIFSICNGNKVEKYIEYENNKFIGTYNGINFYYDKFLDKNSIFMTYISKSGIIDRGYYPLIYKNKIQLVDPFGDLENYSTLLKFI